MDDKKQRLEVLDEISAEFGKFNVFARNYAILKPVSLEQIKKSDSRCAFCGHNETILVGYESDGTVAGGTRSYEYFCQECKNYSVYDHDWG